MARHTKCKLALSRAAYRGPAKARLNINININPVGGCGGVCAPLPPKIPTIRLAGGSLISLSSWPLRRSPLDLPPEPRRSACGAHVGRMWGACGAHVGRMGVSGITYAVARRGRSRRLSIRSAPSPSCALFPMRPLIRF
jgi:hypothetical protein